MNTARSKYYTLLLLAFMFAAPGITAYVFYNHPSWLGASKVNKGTLLTPPQVLNAFGNKSKWRIALWNPGSCDKACLDHLDTLARVRLAIGRKLYYVDQWLVLDSQSEDVDPATKALLTDHDIQVAHISGADLQKVASLSASPMIFLVNPDNYLILSYQTQANPEDIYKDLKLLLNTVENKNG